MSLQKWQRLVIEEERDISSRIARLEDFIEMNGPDSMLEQQLFIMKDYRAILKKRISLFYMGGIMR